MNDKTVYENVDIEVICFDSSDVISCSNPSKRFNAFDGEDHVISGSEW